MFICQLMTGASLAAATLSGSIAASADSGALANSAAAIVHPKVQQPGKLTQKGLDAVTAPQCMDDSIAADSVLREADARFFPHTTKPHLLQELLNDDDSSSDPDLQYVLIARHGETDQNRAGRLQGRGINAPLNELGKAQAKSLGVFLAQTRMHIVSSSLDRAYQTASIIAAENEAQADHNTSIERYAGLDELGWGEMEGNPQYAEPYKTNLAMLRRAWAEGDVTAKAEGGGDSPVEVQERATDAIRQVLKFKHRNNLLVTHGRTMRILLLALSGRSLAEMEALSSVPNTGLYIFAHKRGQFYLLYPTQQTSA